MNSWTCKRVAFVGFAVLFLLEGCGRYPPEIRSLLSFQDVWDTEKSERPYFADIAHEIVARTDSLRQSEVSQVLAKNKINDVIALLEYESPGWNLKGIYTVFVVAKHAVYRIRIFDCGNDVARLVISRAEMDEVCTCVNALGGYKGDQTAGACDRGIVFLTRYKNRKPIALFFKYKPILDRTGRLAKSGSPQMQAFYRLCEILLLAPAENVGSEKTNVRYPCFGKDYGKQN